MFGNPLLVCNYKHIFGFLARAEMYSYLIIDFSVFISAFLKIITVLKESSWEISAVLLRTMSQGSY